jgi:ribose/xylose/arabinose/galactoside ABC-type transport system permease subunit
VGSRHIASNVFELLGGLQTALLGLATVLFALLFTAANERFWSSVTLEGILLSSSWLGILAIGTTFAFSTGAADFSIMANTAFSGIVAAAISGSLSPIVGVPIAILASTAVGLLNAIIVVRFRVNGFLATLVMSGALRGVDYLCGRGNIGIPVTDDFIGSMLATTAGPFPLVFGLVVILALGGAFVMRWTTFGRTFLAVGGNPVAARLAGLNPSRTVMLGYLISGASAGVGGIVLASRLGAGIPAAAAGQELSMFGAVLIAGTSLWGGRANVVGSIVAIVLLAMVYSGLVLSDYPERLQQILAGILLIASVWYVQSNLEERLRRLRLRETRHAGPDSGLCSVPQGGVGSGPDPSPNPNKDVR